MNRKLLLVSLCCLVYFNTASYSEECNNKKIINEEQNQSQQSSFSKFINTWIIPEQNPAFGNDGHSIGLQYGYDMDLSTIGLGQIINRQLHMMAIQYSGSNKFLGIHGRTSVGLTYLYGNDKWALHSSDGKYNTPVFELIQEAVLGNKYIYLTFGIGISWIVKGHSYEMQQQWFDANGYDRNTYASTSVGYTQGGITKFAVPLTASIGHRFDNGLVLEITWKHFSNGHITYYNSAINTIGLSIRYTFGANKKII